VATESETPGDNIDPGTRSVIEAVLFVAEAPVPAKELAEVLCRIDAEQEPDRGSARLGYAGHHTHDLQIPALQHGRQGLLYVPEGMRPGPGEAQCQCRRRAQARHPPTQYQNSGRRAQHRQRTRQFGQHLQQTDTEGERKNMEYISFFCSRRCASPRREPGDW